MNLGAHMSIAGGLHLAVERGVEVGCNVIQIFTKNANQWSAPPLTEEEIKLFKDNVKKHKISMVVAHDTYLINLASPDKSKWALSMKTFRMEMDRTEALGLPYLVTHPGSHMDAGEEEGLKKLVISFKELLHQTEGYKMQILLETTAGQGSALGYKFEHLKYLLENINEPERVHICYDTCHTFVAGYDIRTAESYQWTFEEFDRLIGVNKIKVFHLNDAKKGLATRIDRHEHIGMGELGLDPFRLLLNDPRFETLPMILETPKDDDMDRKNLAVLRSLRKNLSSSSASVKR